MELEDLYEQLEEQFKIVRERHKKFNDIGNKTAEADVRIALGVIKKLVPRYRSESVKVVKSMKK